MTRIRAAQISQGIVHVLCIKKESGIPYQFQSEGRGASTK